jgi:hypothetical protein
VTALVIVEHLDVLDNRRTRLCPRGEVCVVNATLDVELCEVFEVMRWERKPFANVIRMRKLTRQGLVFDERERSLDVSPAGRAQLRQLLATRKADASGEELDS